MLGFVCFSYRFTRVLVMPLTYALSSSTELTSGLLVLLIIFSAPMCKSKVLSRGGGGGGGGRGKLPPQTL